VTEAASAASPVERSALYPSGSAEQRAAEPLIVAAVAADIEVTLVPARLRLTVGAAVDVDLPVGSRPPLTRVG